MTGSTVVRATCCGAPVHDAAPGVRRRHRRCRPGVLLGLAMGSISWLRSVLEPSLTFLPALPPLAYFFLLVIWLGIGTGAEVALLALAALPPAAVATTAAVLAASPVGLTEAARSPRRLPRAGHPRCGGPVRAAGDLHRHPVGGGHGVLVGGRRRTAQRLPVSVDLVKDASNYNDAPVDLVGIFAIGFSGSVVINDVLRAAERRSTPWIGKVCEYELKKLLVVLVALALAVLGWPAARSTTPARMPASPTFGSATRPSPAAT